MTTTATELRAQLAKIEEKTSALLSQLQLLGEQRQSILQQLDAVVYPVLTLPSDVTAEIFMHYLGNFPVITYYDALQAYPPLLLASVCREWRRVALSFPRLWATLSLKWNPRTVHDREQLLKCWLLRAGGCLLDLDLSDSDLTKSKSISAAVVQYAPQLRKLTLTAPQSASHFSSVTGGAQLCFPALQALTVNRPPTTITAFGDAPRLREVCISGGSSSFIALPWHQLMRLDLKYQSAASALQVLEQASNLEVLSLWRISDSDDEQTPIVMKNLHTLIHPSSSWGPLYFLTAPALKTLELGYPTGSDRDALLSLVSRSSWTVQALHLHDQTAEEIIDTLEQFKSLEYLTIQFGDVWDNRISRYRNGLVEIEDEYCSSVFGFLEKRGQLPALKSLSFIDFPMAMDADLLTSMLNSRHQSHGVANLESFKLVFGHPAEEGYEEAHVSQLRALLDHGLNIHIEWPADRILMEVNPEMVTFFVVLRMNPTDLNTGCSNQLSVLTLLLVAHGTYMACRSLSSLPVEI
ncbi:hypothetical protein C8J57DRAFT_1719207 [Mycena rebaudengoi]|nr:hypothetical protein C8J57DRAFT_1719207 [Mycena rebaudengoi]